MEKTPPQGICNGVKNKKILPHSDEYVLSFSLSFDAKNVSSSLQLPTTYKWIVGYFNLNHIISIEGLDSEEAKNRLKPDSGIDKKT